MVYIDVEKRAVRVARGEQDFGIRRRQQPVQLAAPDCVEVVVVYAVDQPPARSQLHQPHCSSSLAQLWPVRQQWPAARIEDRGRVTCGPTKDWRKSYLAPSSWEADQQVAPHRRLVPHRQRRAARHCSGWLTWRTWRSWQQPDYNAALMPSPHILVQHQDLLFWERGGGGRTAHGGGLHVYTVCSCLLTRLLKRGTSCCLCPLVPPSVASGFNRLSSRLDAFAFAFALSRPPTTLSQDKNTHPPTHTRSFLLNTAGQCSSVNRSFPTMVRSLVSTVVLALGAATSVWASQPANQPRAAVGKTNHHHRNGHLHARHRAPAPKRHDYLRHNSTFAPQLAQRNSKGGRATFYHPASEGGSQSSCGKYMNDNTVRVPLLCAFDGIEMGGMGGTEELTVTVLLNRWASL